MNPSVTPPHLYVVEVGDLVAVALIKPDFPGTAGETAIERAIDRFTPAAHQEPAGWAEAQHSNAAPIAPGMSGVIARSGLLAVLALVGAVVFGVWISAIVGVMVGVAIGIYAFHRAGQSQKALGERWRAAHRVLSGADKAEFMQAYALADRVVAGWPEITRWVPLPYPGHTVARVLWDIVLKLEYRAAVRPTRNKLAAARGALRSVDARVKQDVEDRLAEVEEQLAALDLQIGQRMAALRSIGDQCERFLFRQRAIELGQEAVRDADAMRGQFAPSAVPDAVADDLRDHVQGILTAYRELTRDD